MAFGVACVLTDAGKAIIAGRLIGLTAPSQVEPHFQGIGTGATGAARTAVAGDTALTTEVETRVSTNAGTRVTTTVTNDTYQLIQTTTATATRANDEAMLFDAAAAGNSFMSATYTVVTLQTGDGVQNTWKLKST